jgi:hypothetical protein
MAHAQQAYRPRDAEHTVLHAIIREHLDAFLHEATARGDGDGPPEFVEREFRELLTCGVLAHSFARFRRERCAFERLVPFFCTASALNSFVNARRFSRR